MRHRNLSFALPLVLAFACPNLTAQVKPTVAFPLVPEATFETKGLSYQMEDELRTALMLAGDDVRMENVTIPTAFGIEQVDLVLHRFDNITDDFELWVDGKLSKGADEVRADLSLWSGSVEGEADSDVYLAFTPTITLGWISRTDGVAHVFGIDDPEEGWAAG
ncbi:MAG: hypothetical protein ACI8PQ_003220, partial [Planctomycetota bacterium]